MTSTFGSPLERSSDDSRIAFYFIHANLVVVVHFIMPPAYPEKMPDIKVQTLISTRNGKAFSTVYNAYPYSPRWTPPELAERNRIFLLETLPSFKALLQQQAWGV